MKPYYSIIWYTLLLLCSQYVLVLFAVIADLISGIRKARQRGEARRSAALRRTVDKIARYFNALLALSIIDLMQMGAIFYLRYLEDYLFLPLFPVFTVIGALGMALIEVKSIYEKAEEKERRDMKDALLTLSRIMSDKNLQLLIDKTQKNDNS